MDEGERAEHKRKAVKYAEHELKPTEYKKHRLSSKLMERQEFTEFSGGAYVVLVVAFLGFGVASLFYLDKLRENGGGTEYLPWYLFGAAAVCLFLFARTQFTKSRDTEAKRGSAPWIATNWDLVLYAATLIVTVTTFSLISKFGNLGWIPAAVLVVASTITATVRRRRKTR